MKVDVVNQTEKAALAVGGVTASFALHDWSTIVSIAVGLATFLFVVAQLAFLLRRWWRAERNGWKQEQEAD